ncbi:hypothetical protein DPMN_055829 [Dreissena polymorpha]|uniref:Uncharacterized protein n=1 Tax=Dreissena polymorpha TaxID=45954 RepID=A0A9D4HSX9_DREPO|nr:hypothetical protein DPMN_055829 [Dreissena polymorpha]
MYASRGKKTLLQTTIVLLVETEAEKGLDRMVQPTPALQHRYTEWQLELRRFKVTLSNKFQVPVEVAQSERSSDLNMPRRTAPKVDYPQGVDISREATESSTKKIKQSKCQE